MPSPPRAAARVVCFAHVTNTMACGADEFDKGEDEGLADALAIAAAAASAWRASLSAPPPAPG